MKKLYFLALIITATLLACTKPTEGTYTVVKDCDKTFVYDGTDYFLVCNDELLVAVDSGKELNLALKTVDECDNVYEECLTFPTITEKSIVKITYQY
ncbi:MAG: hypothetical protein LRY27_02135 [Chitinophagales bacterium]|nr:hypothetical protein [Chitinophagales bacterium]